ncbi:MAG: cytochrome P460 [Verrucomicrobia bacterium]|nr:cytochrome P460 [Verrucomicrobiota bacterium]
MNIAMKTVTRFRHSSESAPRPPSRAPALSPNPHSALRTPHSLRRRFAWRLSVAVILVAAAFSPALPSSLHAAPVFQGADTLLRPKNYREWVFVGSSIGLEYSPEADKQKSGKSEYKNVYINPAAYRQFAKTGRFPEGTILVLETASSETKNEPGLQGSFQKEFIGLSAAVKDRKRFKEGWAYFRFSEGAGKLKPSAKPAEKSACYDCHRDKGATDHVFTQFYPVLRAAPANKP